MSRKKKQTSAPRPDDALLRTRGLSESEPLDALAKLATSWGSEPTLEAWAVEAAGRLEDPAAGQRLSELQDKTTDKPQRIRRALGLNAQRLGGRHLVTGLLLAAVTPPPP